MQSSKYLAVRKKYLNCDLLQNAVVQVVLKVFCFLKKIWACKQRNCYSKLLTILISWKMDANRLWKAFTICVWNSSSGWRLLNYLIAFQFYSLGAGGTSPIHYKNLSLAVAIQLCKLVFGGLGWVWFGWSFLRYEYMGIGNQYLAAQKA